MSDQMPVCPNCGKSDAVYPCCHALGNHWCSAIKAGCGHFTPDPMITSPETKWAEIERLRGELEAMTAERDYLLGKVDRCESDLNIAMRERAELRAEIKLLRGERDEFRDAAQHWQKKWADERELRASGRGGLSE